MIIFHNASFNRSPNFWLDFDFFLCVFGTQAVWPTPPSIWPASALDEWAPTFHACVTDIHREDQGNQAIKQDNIKTQADTITHLEQQQEEKIKVNQVFVYSYSIWIFHLNSWNQSVPSLCIFLCILYLIQILGVAVLQGQIAEMTPKHAFPFYLYLCICIFACIYYWAL